MGGVEVGSGVELGNVYTSEEEKPAKYSRSNKNRIADTVLTVQNMITITLKLSLAAFLSW